MPKPVKRKTRVLALQDLKFDPHNANKGTDRGRAMVGDSLAKYGAGRSVLAAKDGTLIAGNKTVEQAIKSGAVKRVREVHTKGDELVVVIRDDLAPESKKARGLALADNRAGQVGLEWDTDILADLAANDADALAGLFDERELCDLLGDKMPGGKEETADAGELVDKAAELQKKWGTALGQVWEIGKHRIICGDSTDPECVKRLMGGGGKAQMVWTDPPYGVKYGDKLDVANPITHRVRHIQGDDLNDADLEKLIRSALHNAAQSSVAGASIYVASPAGTQLPTLIKSFVGSGFDFRWHLVWLKDQIVLGRGDYHFKHENLLYGWKPDGAHYFTRDRTQASVFEYARPKKSDEHPTMKPPELVAHMIRNSSKPGDIVMDVFCGSGSTLIACESTGRIGRGIEVSEKYTAVTLERLSLLGLTPKRIDDGNGKTQATA